ncbi:hypothetical protein Ahy_B06g081317 [Arachis hypogaea]|uniref:Uncharacterized protein n=1 Tax=Arachis hypogaea TaxID=3818 RepID=A0A444YKS7_ARAHY|nr:hypothetical protein Ahy_B06g081317 [Arachis hypogaea]
MRFWAFTTADLDVSGSDFRTNTFFAFVVSTFQVELREWNHSKNYTVDRNRHLYDGSALDRAIYRYNACWLPLLAKHSQSRTFEGPLVVLLTMNGFGTVTS